MCCLLRDPAAERREKAGRRSCNLAVQILGPQAEHPGRLLRRATVGAEGAEHGAGKDHAGRTVPPGMARAVVTAIPLPPQV